MGMSSLSPSSKSAPMSHNPSSSNGDAPPSPLPYVARSRRPSPNRSPADEASSPLISPIPSSPAGGNAARTMLDGYKPLPPPKHPLVMSGGSNSAMQDGGSFALNPASAEGRLTTAEMGGASMALARSVRALDGVERIGRLLTLDLRSNEIKVRVQTYVWTTWLKNGVERRRVHRPGLEAESDPQGTQSQRQQDRGVGSRGIGGSFG